MKYLIVLSIALRSLSALAQVPDPVTTVTDNAIETKTFIDENNYIIEGKVFQVAGQAEDQLYDSRVQLVQRLKNKKLEIEAELEKYCDYDPDKTLRLRVPKGSSKIVLSLDGKVRSSRPTIGWLRRSFFLMGLKITITQDKRDAETIFFIKGDGLQNLSYEIK